MVRKFILPLFITPLLLVMQGNRADAQVTAPETEDVKGEVIISDGVTTKIKIKEFKSGGMEISHHAIDTPDTARYYDINRQGDTVGEMLEIIVRDENGNVKKIIRLDKELADGFDFDDDENLVWRRKFKTEHREASKKNDRVRSKWFALDIGLTNYLYNGSTALPGDLNNLDLIPLKSVHVNVGIFQQRIKLIKNTVGFIYGINYDNNDYRFAHDINLKVNDAGDSITYLSRSTNGFVRNKLTTRFLSVPVALRINFKPKGKEDDSPHLTLGAQIGYRLTSFFKTVYRDEGKQKTKKYDDYMLNDLRYGVFAKLGVGDITLYGSYMLSTLFRDGAGPELTPFSFGVSLGGF